MLGKLFFAIAVVSAVSALSTSARATGPFGNSNGPTSSVTESTDVQLAQATPGSTAPNSWPMHTNSDDDTLLRGQDRIGANAGTVTIMTTNTIGAPLMHAARDLSVLLDEGKRFEKLRVVPVIGRGTIQNLWDILFLGGIDMGFIQSDILEYLKDDPRIASIKNRLRYVTVMYPEEVHIVASTNIKTLKELAGKKVSIDAKGTGSAVVGTLLMQRLGITATMVYEDSRISIPRIKSGEIAAHIFVLAKPTELLSKLDSNGELHLLPIPFDQQLADVYLPSTLTAQDYPNLIRAGETVDTIAIGNVLATFNWPSDSVRGAKVKRFVDAFFSHFEELKHEGFHPKWRDVNIAATMPGWTRLEAAQEWLDAHPVATPPVVLEQAQQEIVSIPAPVAADATPASDLMRQHDEELMRQQFSKFLADRGMVAQLGSDAQAVSALFEQFRRWQSTH